MRKTHGFGDDVAEGDTIAKRYRIVRELGRGAMGVVYEAEHLTVGRRVAVKVLSADWATNQKISRRFRAEARAASAAGHPNIIEVLDAGDLDNGRPYLVTEFLAGKDLFELVCAHGRLSVERACRIGLGIARGIDAAHGEGIVHRDLKLENVMVVMHGDQEIVKVLDFGIASDSGLLGRRPTAVGQVLGTPMAMAPEQVVGERAMPSFDIYAIGGVLFELLTGRPAFEGQDMKELLAAKVDQPAPRISTLRADLPAALSALVDECLARAPDERPGTAAEIARRLELVLERLSDRASRPMKNAAVATPSAPGLAEIQHAPTTALGLQPIVEVAPRRRWWPRVAGALGLLVTVVTVGAWGAVATGSQAPLEAADTAIERPSQAREIIATEHRSAIAPSTIREGVPDPAAEAESVSDATDEVDERVDEVVAVPVPVPKTLPTVTDTRSATRKKTKKRVSTPAPAGPSTTQGQDCRRLQKQARQAREHHDWQGVFRYTAASGCWTSAVSERLTLQTKAAMELGQWDKCITLGSKLSGGAPDQWVRTCRLRKERG